MESILLYIKREGMSAVEGSFSKFQGKCVSCMPDNKQMFFIFPLNPSGASRVITWSLLAFCVVFSN